MRGNRRRKRQDDEIHQVLLFIKQLMAQNRLKSRDVFHLCSWFRESGLSIKVSMEPELPSNVPSLWLEYQGQYVILYRGSPFSVFTQLNILHELCHILLGHSPFTPEDLISGRSIYTHSEEMEAELVACKIFSLLNPLKYDTLTENRKSPSAIINHHHGQVFKEVMDVKPSLMTEEEINISRRMSEFFAL